MELVCHYPDVECEGLRRALAQGRGGSYGVHHLRKRSGRTLIFGLTLALKPKKALLPAPTFAEYEQALTACGCETEYYFLSEEEGFRPGEGFLDHIGKDTDMVFFCNPQQSYRGGSGARISKETGTALPGYWNFSGPGRMFLRIFWRKLRSIP